MKDTVRVCSRAETEVVTDPAPHPGHRPQGPPIWEHRRTKRLPGALGNQVVRATHSRQTVTPCQWLASHWC